MDEEIERTVRTDERAIYVERESESFDVAFSNLKLKVSNVTSIREAENRIGLKRFIPFHNVPKVERTILESISGVFRFKRFTAIMGASGAGKTSLLTQISGQLPKKNTIVSGEVVIRGNPVEEIKEVSGFVFQDDVILATMTVEEALKMSAELRLSPEIDKNDRVERMILATSLEKARRTQIGVTGGRKGISGGERKRTSKQRK